MRSIFATLLVAGFFAGTVVAQSPLTSTTTYLSLDDDIQTDDIVEISDGAEDDTYAPAASPSDLTSAPLTVAPMEPSSAPAAAPTAEDAPTPMPSVAVTPTPLADGITRAPLDETPSPVPATAETETSGAAGMWARVFSATAAGTVGAAAWWLGLLGGEL